jgi:membrane fusion protein (multidrug efflux system)
MPRRLLAILIVAALLGSLGYVYTTRRPAGQDGGAPQAGGWGALSQRPVAVVTESVRSLPLSVELEALGTARAREAVDVTSKSANTVTAVRFDEGQRVGKGEVLVELDGAQARADLAAAEELITTCGYHRRDEELADAKRALLGQA